MLALRIGLLAVDGITLAEVTPARERLETLGAQVTLLVPGGGSILPITGRYVPAAGGTGVRRAFSQVTPTDFDLLLLPDSVIAPQLTGSRQVMDFLRKLASESQTPCIPVCTLRYLLHTLDLGSDLSSLANARESVLAAGTRMH